MKLKLTKILSVVLMVIVVASSYSSTAHAVSNNVHDILFDWSYYYNSNSDVARAYGKNPTALRRHYEQWGKKEGRAPSELFNPKHYLQKYSDLKAAFGNDYVAAYNHFVSYGISESRQGSPTFNVAVYKANYLDLRNAFGNNNLLYLKHYREYGKSENRNAITEINSTTTASKQPIADGYYTIAKGSYGLNVQYAVTTGIGNMVLDPINNEGNEIFYIKYVKSHNAYYITPYYRSGVAINALYGSSCKVGSQLKAHPSNTGDTASLWYITREANNTYRFQNVACKMYITVAGSTSTGTPLVMKNKQSWNQTFSINKVTRLSNSTNPTPNTNTGWQWPMKGYWTTQSFGNKGHLGIDIKSTSDTKVYAVAAGQVVAVGLNGTGTDASVTSNPQGNGYYIVIKHTLNGKTVYSMYGHLQKGSIKVQKGQTLKGGEVIATYGNTGNSTGRHLHFAIANTFKSGSYYGYTSNRGTFNSNSKYESRSGVTFYNPVYVINNQRLP